MTTQTPLTDQSTPDAPAEEPAAVREYIGFFGCPRAGVLKVRVPGRTEQAMRVACPACAEVHIALKPMIRERLPGEEVALIADDTPMDVTSPPPPSPPYDPTVLKGRQRVSDAAILAAIGEQDAPAGEVGRALGYARPGELLKRLARMNSRAAKADIPEPFIITRGGRRKPALVRRSEA